MNYQWFEQDINDAWITNLLVTYSEIQDEFYKHTVKTLAIPNFIINNNLNYRWAEWNKSTRTITFSINLLRNYEWAAVKHVMKHEVAHQIVDEYFNIEAMPHGDAWKKACLILDIPPNVSDSHITLDSFKGGNPSTIIEKIRKLILHGNDHHISQEESQLFLNKAQELMIKHNVSMQNIQGVQSNTFYAFRPVGPLVDGHKTWLGQISTLVCTFYNVQSIWLHCKNKRRLEFFGTKDNLDVAEYVFHALLTQAEYFWEQYKSEHQSKFKNDPNYRSQIGNSYNGNSHRISKRAFIQGLVTGYQSKLRKEQSVVLDSISPNDKAIISANDGILRDTFEKKYNPRKLTATSTTGQGYSDGHAIGKNLTLAQGITRSTSNRSLIEA